MLSTENYEQVLPVITYRDDALVSFAISRNVLYILASLQPFPMEMKIEVPTQSETYTLSLSMNVNIDALWQWKALPIILPVVL
jgi:hypothetical protein